MNRSRLDPRRLARASGFHLRRLLRRPAWKLLGLRSGTRSGLVVPIRDEADWILFDDIFVRGEYDPAIDALLERGPVGERIEILDLGANVGYFSLRAAQRILEEGGGRDFRVTLVEVSPRIYRRLRRNLDDQEPLRGRIDPVHGLVGRTGGSARIVERSFHATSRVLESDEGAGRGEEVAYHDLRPYAARVDSIDLLKCDIEGAEEAFLESYRDLLAKVRLAVFELHHDACDTERCRELLGEAGLAHRATLVSAPATSLELFVAEPPEGEGAP